MKRVAFFLGLSAVVAACSLGEKETSKAKPRSGNEVRCRQAHPKWPARDRPAFFPASRAGLWVPRELCVYVVHPGDEDARPFWRGRPGESVRGIAWAPDGESVAITTESPNAGWQVVLVGRDGAVLRRLAAMGAAFLHDGRLAVSRQDGIDLLVDSRARHLASREDLERIAGFRARRLLLLGHDPWGYTRGNGRGRLALTLWSEGSHWKSVVLVVDADGKVRRATPAYRAEGIEGVVSGWAWSPDGRELFVMAEVPGPAARRRAGAHDHCLDIWSAGNRRRASANPSWPGRTTPTSRGSPGRSTGIERSWTPALSSPPTERSSATQPIPSIRPGSRLSGNLDLFALRESRIESSPVPVAWRASGDR